MIGVCQGCLAVGDHAFVTAEVEHVVHVPVQVPQIQTVERQVPVVQYVDVPVDVPVQVPVEVQVPVDVPQYVDVPRHVPVPRPIERFVDVQVPQPSLSKRRARPRVTVASMEGKCAWEAKWASSLGRGRIPIEKGGFQINAAPRSIALFLLLIVFP